MLNAALSQADFDYLGALICECSGIVLDERRQRFVHTLLSPLAEAEGSRSGKLPPPGSGFLPFRAGDALFFRPQQ